MSSPNNPIDLSWVDKQTNAYKESHKYFVAYADLLKLLFQRIAKSQDMEAIVQARAKTIASFSEKIVRKSYKYKDPVNQFTDLCGARIITQTQSQVKAMCELIEDLFEIDWENSMGVDERLKPAEFGYRSVHYIVQLKQGEALQEYYGQELPEGVLGLKAEVQVRTLLEHAWADLYHIWAYKNEFEIPLKLQREMAGIAARLEAADNAFSGVQEELKKYYSSYGAYMDREQLTREMEKLEITLKYDPDNLSLIRQLGRAALALEDWDKAIAITSPVVSSGDGALLRIRGTALCKKYKAEHRSTEFLQGQELLLKAGSPPGNNSDALATLAGSWKGIDDDQAREYYRQAFELDPTDAYPLGNYLESEIMKDRNLSIIGFTKPVIRDAIQRSLSCIDVKVNLPWAWYDIGKLHLFLGDPYASFSAYARAVDLSTAPFMIETALDSLANLAGINSQIPGYDWIVWLLWLGWAAKFSSEKAKSKIKEMGNSLTEETWPGCTVLVGGSKHDVEDKMELFGPLLKEAFKEYRGMIVSGGTKTGISKLTGDLKEAFPDQIDAIGYLPAAKKARADGDKKRYDEIRFTDGESFSPLEATRYWLDLLASGISPDRVKLLVINGGKISAAECELALILGARVGILEGSGGEPVKLFSDPAWKESASLLLLPGDPHIISSYISSVQASMNQNIRDVVAREIHQRYLDGRVEKLETDDPSMQPWEKLDQGLKHSNYCQADQIFEKLERFGYGVKKLSGSKIKIYDFKEDDDRDVVEQMAKWEHARWVIERLSEGWKFAQKKDVKQKLSPYLVSWDGLTEDIKDYDRETVRNIPAYLAKVGLEVYKLSR